jgi:hypothetical protein
MVLALVLIATVTLVALGIILRRIATATREVSSEVDALQAGLVPALVRLETNRATTQARREHHTR